MKPGADRWALALESQRLMEAHDVLSRLMPAPDAESSVWREYYQRSATVYERVAEIDRGHHHEALYWATRERQKGEEIEQQRT